MYKDKVRSTPKWARYAVYIALCIVLYNTWFVVWHLRSLHHAPRPEAVEGKLALVGILSVPSKFERRSLIRTTYMLLKPPSIDVFFVFGRPSTPEEEALLRLEQAKYGDIMIVDCQENMDDGKTYAYFSHLGKSFPPSQYAYVMKTDDDVWLHLGNLADRLKSLPRSGLYFGRHVPKTGFMAGMGYVLSWDIVRWISQDPFPAAHQVGQEDAMLAYWLRQGEQVKHFVSEDWEFYDEPDSGKGWAHAYSPNTILIHQLKNTSWFIKAAEHFLRDVLVPFS